MAHRRRGLGAAVLALPIAYKLAAIGTLAYLWFNRRQAVPQGGGEGEEVSMQGRSGAPTLSPHGPESGWTEMFLPGDAALQPATPPPPTYGTYGTQSQFTVDAGADGTGGPSGAGGAGDDGTDGPSGAGDEAPSTPGPGTNEFPTSGGTPGSGTTEATLVAPFVATESTAAVFDPIPFYRLPIAEAPITTFTVRK